MSFSMIFSAVMPVLLILILGYKAGKNKEFDTDQSLGLSRLALHYALPVSLFLGMAQFNRDILFHQGSIIIIMIVGYSLFFFVIYFVLRVRGIERIRSILLSYAASSTAAPIYGLTVLVPIYGVQEGSGVVGLVALITNLFQVSVTVFMLQSGLTSEQNHISLLKTVWASIKNPLVLGPILGALISCVGISIPNFATNTLRPLASSSAAVAIFACGLTLSKY